MVFGWYPFNYSLLYTLKKDIDINIKKEEEILGWDFFVIFVGYEFYYTFSLFLQSEYHDIINRISLISYFLCIIKFNFPL
jgi:hypothetical protein